MDQNKIDLDLAAIEDDTVFDAQYREWDVKSLLNLQDDKTLRVICQLWFFRGARHGMKWADKTLDKMIENGK